MGAERVLKFLKEPTGELHGVPDPSDAPCYVCESPVRVTEANRFCTPFFCAGCQKRLPAALRKACNDEFNYTMGLKSGKEIEFSSAEINGDWVHLKRIPGLERGMDVRLSEIEWVADGQS
jgi:hypothetical protein